MSYYKNTCFVHSISSLFLSVYQLLNMLGRVKICETSSISFYFTLSKKLIITPSRTDFK